MVQVVDVESESQSGMLSGTANGRATTIWEPRRCRGKVLEDCRTASERVTRRKDVRCVRRGRRRKSAFPIVRVHIEVEYQDEDDARAAKAVMVPRAW
jgi:hypothetical protein